MIRQRICETRNPGLFPELQIPRSTANSWLQRGCPTVITVTEEMCEVAELQNKIAALEATVRRWKRRAHGLLAVAKILKTKVMISGFRLNKNRLPDATTKEKILDVIHRAKRALPTSTVLRMFEISSSRYGAWRRRVVTECGLEDRTSCPRSSPNGLTPDEILAIKGLVLSEEHRHMPTTTLALFAQRTRKVFASVSTWRKLIEERGWKRPRKRVYPARPKIGIRATRSNAVWHIDLTVIRLLCGAKIYLHAVIDNYSRKILAWRLVDKVEPATTVAILEEAAGNLSPNAPTPEVMMDAGVENVNAEVDGLNNVGSIRRVLAQVDVVFSNSMIERFWLSLKFNWLYLHTIDTMETVRKLIAFYVDQHNTVPHSAFRGQTPNEMYAGTGDHIPAQLIAERKAARERRLAANRDMRCAMCDPDITEQPDFPNRSEASQLRTNVT